MGKIKGKPYEYTINKAMKVEEKNNVNNRTAVKLFESKQIRTIWDDDAEEWYFSIVDVVGLLTESENPRSY